MILNIESVSKSFGKGESNLRRLSGVQLALGAGDCISLVGANGSGKSTILRMACGLLAPDSGTVRVLGENPSSSRRAREKTAVFIDGALALYARLTPEENFDYFTALRGSRPAEIRPRFKQIAENLGLSSYLRQQVRKLSKGTQQKVALAIATAKPSPLWVLDEPTLGLDDASAERLRCMVLEHVQRGGAALLATHERGFASVGRLLPVEDFYPAAGKQASKREPAVHA